MIVILLLIPLSVAFAAAFLAAFIWSVRSGQYEDTYTPSMRLLLEDVDPDIRCRPNQTSTSGGLNQNSETDAT